MEKNNQQITQAYNDYSSALLRYCLFKISNKEKAVDIVQETFTRTWLYLSKGNTIENIKPFLYATARHLIIDEYRKKKNVSLDALTELGLEPKIQIEENFYSPTDISRVMECVEKLPASYSSIITMRYVKDLSVQNIARMLHTSENVVSVRIHRGLSKLRMIVPK
jgi:RNA polymerase sigma-70 factor, ECF subfamily